MMDDLTSTYFTEAEKEHYINKVHGMKTREKKLEYLKNMRNNLDDKLHTLISKQQVLSEMNRQIGRIIRDMESMDDDVSKSDLTELFNMLPNSKGG